MLSALLNEDLWKVVNLYSFKKAKTYATYTCLVSALKTENYSLISSSPFLKVDMFYIDRVISFERLDVIEKYFPSTSRYSVNYCRYSRSDTVYPRCVFDTAYSWKLSARVCAHVLKNTCSCIDDENRMTKKYVALFSAIVRDRDFEMLDSFVEISRFGFRELIASIYTGLTSIRNSANVTVLVVKLYNLLRTEYPNVNLDKFYEACLILVCRLQDRELANWFCSVLPDGSSVRLLDMGTLDAPSDLYILNLLRKNNIVYRSYHCRGDVNINRLIEADKKDAVVWFAEKIPYTHVYFDRSRWKMLMNRNTETVKYLCWAYGTDFTSIHECSWQYISPENIYKLYTEAINSTADSEKRIVDVIDQNDNLLSSIMTEAWRRRDVRCIRLLLDKFRDTTKLLSTINRLSRRK